MRQQRTDWTLQRRNPEPGLYERMWLGHTDLQQRSGGLVERMRGPPPSLREWRLRGNPGLRERCLGHLRELSIELYLSYRCWGRMRDDRHHRL